MKIAMVSEHASPLAVLGGVDAGGQNVHLAALSAEMVADGHTVTVYTRRDSVTAPTEVTMAPGVGSCTSPPAPRNRLARTRCCPTWAVSGTGWPITGAGAAHRT